MAGLIATLGGNVLARARSSRQPGASSSRLIRFAAVLTLASVCAAEHQQPASTPLGDASRMTLLRLQREAVVLLTQAGRADVSAEEVRRVLLEARQRLEALSGGIEARGASDAGHWAGLSPALQAELRGAARELVAASRPDAAGQRVDTSPFLALLERVRVQLEGEIALGLSLQGSSEA
jgi:hypothetical protein